MLDTGCAAMIHPDATPDQLNVSSDWLAWGLYGDDLFPVLYGRTGDLTIGLRRRFSAVPRAPQGGVRSVRPHQLVVTS
jgi:hypothetical protein